jgi:single-stranded-DNA-specific exonuclease
MSDEWLIPPPWPQRDDVARRLRISPVAAQVLHNRGLTDPDDIRRFLEPRIADLHPPETLPGATFAAERIAAAIADRRRIVLYGDYDVDGVTGVAILWHTLRLAGAEPEFYIPHRLEEGYGVNTDAVQSLADQGAQLIITVDCGVTAHQAADLARRRGVELIITDHHAPLRDEQGRPVLPDASCIVHPALNPSDSNADSPPSNPDLSGAGVALKLAWAVFQRVSGSDRVRTEFRDFLVTAIGLAALGLIADVVPLTGENRIIACHGLRGLPHAPLPGVAAMIEACGLTGARLTGYDIGFRIAPRLNAVGRMGHARLAVELFTRADDDEARRIARNLEQHNTARRSLERRIANEARQMVRDTRQDSDAARAIVLAAERWHAGVIGIVASRLVDEFRRPTVLIALENGAGQGSARSIPGFHLNEALAACREHLTTFGGHAMAAGLRLDSAAAAPFAHAFQRFAAQRLTAADLRRRVRLDDEVRLADLDEQLVRDFAAMEPSAAATPPRASPPVGSTSPPSHEPSAQTASTSNSSSPRTAPNERPSPSDRRNNAPPFAITDDAASPSNRSSMNSTAAAPSNCK